MDNQEKTKFLKEGVLPLIDAWSLVALADRINGGQYIKFAELDQETGNVKLRPNRDIIADQVKLGMVNITDEDRALAQQLNEHFQYIAMDAITGKISEFDQKILNLITEEKVNVRMGLAYLACMPSRYRRELVKERKKEELDLVARTSIHQGEIGQKLNLKVRVVAKYMGRAFPGSVVRATDGTNMYFWSSSMMVDMWPDSPEEFPIVGVVKAHGNDQFGTKETRLTRVKIL